MTAAWREYAEGTYENNTDRVDLATVWTAHLPLAVSTALPHVLAALQHHEALTGEYLHEPSYRQWGEPTKTGHDPYAPPGTTARFDPDHLALYFHAPTQSQALEVAQILLSDLQGLDAALGSPHEVVVTHADDWDWDHTITPTRGAPPPDEAPTRSAAIITLANALRAAQTRRTTAEHTGDQHQWAAAEAECKTWVRALSAEIRRAHPAQRT